MDGRFFCFEKRSVCEFGGELKMGVTAVSFREAILCMGLFMFRREFCSDAFFVDSHFRRFVV